MLTNDQLLQIAKTEAERRGYDVKRLRFHIDSTNENWNKFWPPFSKYNPDITERLKGKEVAAIYYDQEADGKSVTLFGGGGWILIDKISYKVVLFQAVK